MMTDEEKAAIADVIKELARTCDSHKAAITRLAENENAAHSTAVEMADILNSHAKLLEDMEKVWTENFTKQGELLNQQTRVLEAIRSLVLPGERPN